MTDLTPYQEAVLAVLEGVADRGAPMPQLYEIQNQTGVDVGAISAILFALDRKRIIELRVVRTKGTGSALDAKGERGRVQRQVTILRTGRSTAPIEDTRQPWRDFVPPELTAPCFQCGCRMDACACGRAD